MSDLTKLTADFEATLLDRNELLAHYQRVTAENLRLKERLEKCEAALREAQQAFSEIYHAYTDPSWFTKGESGARNHIFNWIDRGSKAARATLEEK